MASIELIDALDEALSTPTEWAELGVELGAPAPAAPAKLAGTDDPLPPESPMDEHCVNRPQAPVYARESLEQSTADLSACSFTVDALAAAMNRHCGSADLDQLIEALRQRRLHLQAFCEHVKDKFGPEILIHALQELSIAASARHRSRTSAACKRPPPNAEELVLPTLTPQLVPRQPVHSISAVPSPAGRKGKRQRKRPRMLDQYEVEIEGSESLAHAKTACQAVAPMSRPPSPP